VTSEAQTLVGNGLPAELDLSLYRQLNPDLQHMTDQELGFHYRTFGQSEGRRCAAVHNRESFTALVPGGIALLEIGPSWAPAFRRPAANVKYLDVFEREELQRRAARDPSSRGAMVPEIDFIWRGGRYRDIISQQFDAVYSSHNIEHQPDLVSHLADVSSVLRVGGGCFLVVPDKRYCFDYFLPETTIAEVIEAHAQHRIRHSVATLLCSETMHTHNDPKRHWAGDHGPDPRYAEPGPHRANLIRHMLSAGKQSDGYVDSHAWRFTPSGFRSIFAELHGVGLTDLVLRRVYSTIRGSFEFYAVLAKDMAKFSPAVFDPASQAAKHQGPGAAGGKA
jgi:SAM-dependent methyltransferase